MTDTRIRKQETPSQSKLKPNSLGVLGILFFALSAQAPLTGIAGSTPIVVAIGNGAGVPASFIGAGITMLLFSFGYVAMSRYVTKTGAFYAYVSRGLGFVPGIGAAALALFAYATIQACMYGLYGATVSGLFSQYFSIDVPWWIIAVVTMIGIQILGTLGIEIGSKVLAVLVSFEFLLLGLFALVTLFKGGGPEGLNFQGSFGFDAALSGAPGVALAFGVAAMFGFEATAIYSEEAREPKKTIPRATFLAITIVTVFFSFVSWMFVSYYGASHVAEKAGAILEAGNPPSVFVSDAVGATFGSWAGEAVSILLATSLFAGILAFHNSITRYLFALSRDGVIHGGLQQVNSRQSPSRAGLAQTIGAFLLVIPFALLGLDPVLTLFSWFSGVAVLAMLCLYFLTSISVIMYFRKRNDINPPGMFSTTIAPILSVIVMAFAVWLIVSNFEALTGGAGLTATLLILAVPVVFILGTVWASLKKSSIDAEAFN